MRYAVVWRDTALQQLAAIWMASTDREAVNSAVDEIDAELANDPDQKGEDYFGDRYVLNPVLWTLYHTYSGDLTVHVLQVGRIGVDRPHDETP